MRQRCLIILSLAFAGSVPCAALGQGSFGPPVPGVASAPIEAAGAPSAPAGSVHRGAAAADRLSNPVSLLEEAANAVPGGGLKGGISGAMSILILMTVLSLVPAIMVMCTCFVRFSIVLGLLKQAMGTQTLPPAQVIMALSLFMTFMVMSPTLGRIQGEALGPYQRGEVTDPVQVWERARQPLRDFMFAQIEASDNWSGVYMILNYRGVDTSKPAELTRSDVDMLTLIPAYMLSELKTSFLMGFRVYLPFLVIDMVISSLLISMSMMMLPPVLISLPFKLLLFVLVDGWQLVVGSLMTSVAQPGRGPASAAMGPMLGALGLA